VIEALKQINVSGMEVTIVAGPTNSHYAELEKALDDPSAHSIFQLLRSTDAMPELMAWADLGISGAGSTCWELAFMGLPSINLIVADNQRTSALLLAQERMAIVLDYASAHSIAESVSGLMSDVHLRRSISEKNRTSVRGSGAQEVLKYLNSNEAL
jgi:spore coat polysaccharide biosynthesis predicted glycosyltransferase SpsG